MKKFTNQNIQKEEKLLTRRIIICLVIILATFSLVVAANIISKKTNEEITDLNSIIMSEGEKTEKKAYLDIKSVPYEFAVSEDIIESYYMVSDGEYLYIAYMGPEDFEKLNKEDIKENPIRIEGITRQTEEEIKKLAIETYNEGLEEEQKITLNEFDSYFGDVYLNMAVEENSMVTTLEAIFFIAIFTEVILLIVFVCQLIKYKRSISKMEDSLIEELDNEMNDTNAFYYEKTHMYLTNKYIINFNGEFVVINYKDIVWMYAYEQRTNGIKTTQAIKVMTNEGKTYTIATIDVISKSKKEIYNEIWNTIISKNNTIALGYTKENIKEMKEKYKNKKTQHL